MSEGSTLNHLPWYDVVYPKIFSLLSIRDICYLTLVREEWRSCITNYLSELEDVDLSIFDTFDFRAFRTLVQSCVSVRRFNVASCRWVRSDHVRLLGQFRGGEVTSLEIAECLENSVEHMLHFSNLVYLKLSACPWTDANLSRQLIENNQNLLTLNLDRSPLIDDEAVRQMSTSRSFKLKTLSLRGCPITDHGLMLLKRCDTLEELDVRTCQHITTEGVNFLYGMSSLRSLRVGDCPFVFSSAIRPLGVRKEIDIMRRICPVDSMRP